MVHQVLSLAERMSFREPQVPLKLAEALRPSNASLTMRTTTSRRSHRATGRPGHAALATGPFHHPLRCPAASHSIPIWRRFRLKNGVERNRFQNRNHSSCPAPAHGASRPAITSNCTIDVHWPPASSLVRRAAATPPPCFCFTGFRHRPSCFAICSTSSRMPFISWRRTIRPGLQRRAVEGELSYTFDRLPTRHSPIASG